MLSQSVDAGEESVEQAVRTVAIGSALVVVGAHVSYHLRKHRLPGKRLTILETVLGFGVGVAVHLLQVVAEAVVGVVQQGGIGIGRQEGNLSIHLCALMGTGIVEELAVLVD